VTAEFPVTGEKKADEIDLLWPSKELTGVNVFKLDLKIIFFIGIHGVKGML
jgi:hypothetical protein